MKLEIFLVWTALPLFASLPTFQYQALCHLYYIWKSYSMYAGICTCIHDPDSCYMVLKLSSKSSREDMCRLPTSFLLNIQSHVKQEVDMPQIQNCVTRYSSPYWCSVPNIKKLASVVPEKNVTEIFCDANARWQKWSLYVASTKAGRWHNNT